MKITRVFILALLGSLALFTLSCGEEEDTFDEVAQFAEDLEAIDEYITENNITDTLHHYTGIRYKIHTEGIGGVKALVGDQILVDYKGYFLNNEVFDQGKFGDDPPVILNSASMINGWFFMCQEMREGDSITIYVPSVYGYGQRGSSGAIPPNTPLIFDMKMLRVGP